MNPTPPLSRPGDSPGDSPDDEAVIAATSAWLEDIVIGLNLCPFAKAVHRRGQIRYVVSAATDTEALAADLEAALRALAAADSETVDTTLLIHPQVLADFIDYNAFLKPAERLLKKLGLRGALQIASFHPHYVFADAEDDAIENYSNRSPYPMLHLLREDSVERAVAAFPQAESIYENNIATLRRLGLAGLQALGKHRLR